MSVKNLTNEQLEQIAKKKGSRQKKTQKRANVSHVAKFVQDKKIQEGKYKVPNYTLYFIYCKEWMPTGKKLSKIGFLREFSRLFSQKRTGVTRYYMLNIETTKEFIKETKEYDKKHGSKRKNRKTKKNTKK